jgi:hypothetical protein
MWLLNPPTPQPGRLDLACPYPGQISLPFKISEMIIVILMMMASVYRYAINYATHISSSLFCLSYFTRHNRTGRIHATKLMTLAHAHFISSRIYHRDSDEGNFFLSFR